MNPLSNYSLSPLCYNTLSFARASERRSYSASEKGRKKQRHARATLAGLVVRTVQRSSPPKGKRQERLNAATSAFADVFHGSTGARSFEQRRYTDGLPLLSVRTSRENPRQLEDHFIITKRDRPPSVDLVIAVQHRFSRTQKTILSPDPPPPPPLRNACSRAPHDLSTHGLHHI